MSLHKRKQRAERQMLTYAKTLGKSVVQRNSGEGRPVWMMTGAHKRISFTIRGAGNFMDFGPRRFLN